MHFGRGYRLLKDADPITPFRGTRAEMTKLCNTSKEEKMKMLHHGWQSRIFVPTYLIRGHWRLR